jgi:uncharacterized membrane protein
MAAAKRERLSVSKRITVQRTPADVYRFWRNPQNARGVVPETVEVFRLSETRSHWVAHLPAGRRLQCTLDRTADAPERHLAWRSVGESDVDFDADLRFAPAAEGEQTEIVLTLHWISPPGWAGALLSHAAKARAGRVLENILEQARTALEAGVTV